MAINFTSSVNDFATTAARATRSKNFTEFTSKKKLEEANVLTEAQLSEIKKIKGTFTFALHTEGRYMVITLYHANTDRKYQFLILDLANFQVAEMDSVKNAKAAVLEQIAADKAAQEAPKAEEAPATGEEPKSTDAPADEPKKGNGRKNTKK